MNQRKVVRHLALVSVLIGVVVIGTFSQAYAAPPSQQSRLFWTLEGEELGDELSAKNGTAGDVNGDGYGDVVLERKRDGEPPQIMVYYGGPNGINDQPDWWVQASNEEDVFGAAQIVGDIDGDGYDELVIANIGYDSNTGRIYLYYGGPNGVESRPGWTADGDAEDDFFGTTLLAAGDVNGDGYADFAVGALGHDEFTGQLYVFYGGRRGPANEADFVVPGQNQGDLLTLSMAALGDVNGDGYDEIVVGAPNYDNQHGRAYVLLGGADGLEASEALIYTGENVEDGFGTKVAGPGDINNDGYNDVILRASAYDENRSKLYIFYGDPRGLARRADQTIVGENADDYLGHILGPIGDTNGDGFADVVMSLEAVDDSGSTLQIFYGSADGLASTPDFIIAGENEGDNFGRPYMPLGDINGDGFADIAISADGYDNERGKVYFYLGSPNGFQSAGTISASGTGGLSEQAVWVGLNPTARIQGYSFTVAGAGDLNGDGIADVALSVPAHNDFAGRIDIHYGGQGEVGLLNDPDWVITGENEGDFLGISISSAGDVNGDGYDELLLGAHLYPEGDNQGRAYLFQGGADGLGASPDWVTSGEAIGDEYGRSVSGAGDVNGDGYDDVLVASALHEGGRGRVYLYFGSEDGLSSRADWFVTGPNTDDGFGEFVSGVGDIDNDGYDDIAISAHLHDDGQGRLWIVPGSENGPVADAPWIINAPVAEINFGIPVAPAGDVNSDGFADIIVGALHFQQRRGAALVYFGSEDGPLHTEGRAGWFAVGENEGDSFGSYAWGAGDVNNDGYDDIAISALYYEEPGGRGKLYVYHGGPEGLGEEPNFTSLGSDAEGDFGRTLNAAGDVNGDGVDDLIVGQPSVNAEADEEAVYVYFGAGSGDMSSAVDTITALGSDLAIFTLEGESAGDRLGDNVSTGDFNGDGLLDAVIGSDGFQEDSGAVYIAYDIGSGFGDGPGWSFYGQNADEFVGSAVPAIADFNDDGYDDLVIGASGEDESRGTAYLFWGSADGLSDTPAWIVSGEIEKDRLGSAIAAGDVNGDGYPDLLIGASGNNGVVYVWFGDPNGLAENPDQIISDEGSNSFGATLVVNDFDGDGIDDAFIAEWGYNDASGAIHLYYGLEEHGLSARPNRILEGENSLDFLGMMLASVGDVNGDGWGDAIFSAPFYPGGGINGRAYLLLGDDIVFRGTANYSANTLEWIATGAVEDDKLGWAVGPAGDINGDGFTDVLIGTTGIQEDTGFVNLYLGSASGLSAEPYLTIWGDSPNERFGAFVNTLGDIDGDGYDDFVIQAGGYPNDENAGRIYIFLGGPDLMNESGIAPPTSQSNGEVGGLRASIIDRADWAVDGDPTDKRLGFGLAAGDINGDGFIDFFANSEGPGSSGVANLFLGAETGYADSPNWHFSGEADKAFLGNGSPAISDVNGDGYGDVLIGSSGMNDSAGRVYLFYGNPDGLADEPDWVVDGSETDADLGGAFAMGDLNGDGYADVLLGEVIADGQVLVWLGSPEGISGAPWQILRQRGTTKFGQAIGIADVNADGLDDAIIVDYGSPEVTGGIYVYLGDERRGLRRNPAWAASEPGFDFFLSKVANAGDINGDGIDDILISSLYAQGSDLSGGVLLYLGGADVTDNPSPAWSLYGEEGDVLGISVSAGDANADGYNDVVVGVSGAGENGETRVFLGSPEGLSQDPVLVIEGENAGDSFGAKVGVIGDINGDGSDELLISAVNFPGGEAQGRVYLLFGDAN